MLMDFVAMTKVTVENRSSREPGRLSKRDSKLEADRDAEQSVDPVVF